MIMHHVALAVRPDIGISLTPSAIFEGNIMNPLIEVRSQAPPIPVPVPLPRPLA